MKLLNLKGDGSFDYAHRCKCHIMHWNKITKACGYAVVYSHGFGGWTACNMPAAGLPDLRGGVTLTSRMGWAT